MTKSSGWELTGNHDLAFPCIDPANGALHTVNVLQAARRGIVEWSGSEEVGSAETPLLAPVFRVDGRLTRPDGLRWDRVERWMPRWRASLGAGIDVTATICAPPGIDRPAPGGVYAFTISNGGRDAGRVEVALEGAWRWSLLTVSSSRPLAGVNHLLAAAAGTGLVLEAEGGPALAILAAAGGAPVEAAGWPDLRTAEATLAPNGTGLDLRVGVAVAVPPGGKASVAFFFGVGPERDGALGAAHALGRAGSDDLVRGARLDLARLTRRIDSAPLAKVLNRNLLFSFFFGMGRAVDDDRMYPLRSRSPLCQGQAVVREREALFWSLPAIMLAEPHFAREILLRCFEQYAHRAGEQGRYVDGGVLEPGFALDQACAYAVALDRYLTDTGDESLAREPVVQDVLRELDAALLQRLHPTALLCETERLASGEPAGYPYVTVGNVMLWVAAGAISRHLTADEDEPPANFAGAQEEVAAAIWRHCTVEVNGLRILAFATDADGRAAVYDDPDASLALLPFLGFCAEDDPIWSNTIEWLRSAEYPHWLADRPFPGLTTRRDPEQAHLAAICADLLGPRSAEALDLLLRLELDADVAAGRYDPATGRAVSQPYHAAVAGLLAWTLWRVAESR